MLTLYNKAFHYLDNSKPSHFGIYASLFLHLSLLLFAIGLPDFFKPKKILIPQVIPIEILNISDVTSLTPKKENKDISSKQTKKIEQKKFNASENTEIQKIDLQEKQKKKLRKNENIIQDKPITKEITLREKKIDKPKKENILKLDKPEALKSNKIKPKLKPKPIESEKPKTDLQLENKPKLNIKKIEDKKILDKPKPIEKPEPDFNLATMLKDLRNEEITNAVEENNKKDDKDDKEEINENDNREQNLEVSISEMDLVLQQLRSCFNPRAGTQIVGDEMVKISAKIDKTAKVRKDTVQIIATNISKNNPYYEAITESAVATLYNPLCSTLKLPLDKYESWKDLKITIDYSWIKN